MGQVVAWRSEKRKGVKTPLRIKRENLPGPASLPKGFFLELENRELFELHKEAAAAVPVMEEQRCFQVSLGQTQSGLHAYIQYHHRYFWMVFDPDLTPQSFLAVIKDERCLRLLLRENGIPLGWD